MSKLNRYIDSLHKFIKDKSCLLNTSNLPNETTGEVIYNTVKESGLILSILLLTVMNNQNKKNKISVQGYYAAATIEFLHTLINIIENKEQIKIKHGDDIYYKIINYLTLCSSKSICQNLETAKNSINNDELSSKIFINSMKIFNNNLSYDKILNEKELKIQNPNPNPNHDISKWYIKNDTKLNKIFSNIKQVDKTVYDNYVDDKIGSLCEIAICIGWLLGCGNEKKLTKLKKISKYFAIFYKISIDMQNLDKDIRNNKGTLSYNFVINNGLQNSYEIFMDNKRKFIEEAIKLDIYTSTIKEIINFIESKVDVIIDETSPDIKSNYSNL